MKKLSSSHFLLDSGPRRKTHINNNNNICMRPSCEKEILLERKSLGPLNSNVLDSRSNSIIYGNYDGRVLNIT